MEVLARGQRETNWSELGRQDITSALTWYTKWIGLYTPRLLQFRYSAAWAGRGSIDGGLLRGVSTAGGV